MPKLRKAQVSTIVDSMFHDDELIEKTKELREKALNSLRDHVESTIKSWHDKNHFNLDNPLLVEVVGVRSDSSPYDGSPIYRFEKPLMIPAVGEEKDTIIGSTREIGGEYVLRFMNHRLFWILHGREKPYYEIDDKTISIIKEIFDIREKFRDEKSKLEDIVNSYVGKELSQIKKKDPFLYEVVAKAIHYVENKTINPDNLSDLVNNSEHIKVPDLKLLTGSSSEEYVQVVED